MQLRGDDIDQRIERLIRAVRAVERVRTSCRSEKALSSTIEWREQQAARTALRNALDCSTNQVEIFG